MPEERPISVLPTSPPAGQTSGPADAHDFAAAPVELDNGGFEETWRLPWQAALKDHTPDTTGPRRGSFGSHAVGFKRHVRARDFNGTVPADLFCLGRARHSQCQHGGEKRKKGTTTDWHVQGGVAPERRLPMI